MVRRAVGPHRMSWRNLKCFLVQTPVYSLGDKRHFFVNASFQAEGQDVLKVTYGVMVAGLEPRPPGSQVSETWLVLVLPLIAFCRKNKTDPVACRVF